MNLAEVHWWATWKQRDYATSFRRESKNRDFGRYRRRNVSTRPMLKRLVALGMAFRHRLNQCEDSAVIMAPGEKQAQESPSSHSKLAHQLGTDRSNV